MKKTIIQWHQIKQQLRTIHALRDYQGALVFSVQRYTNPVFKAMKFLYDHKNKLG